MQRDNSKGLGSDSRHLFREYDPEICRWKSLDPKLKDFPSESPFSAMGNNPIMKIDPKGDAGTEALELTALQFLKAVVQGVQVNPVFVALTLVLSFEGDSSPEQRKNMAAPAPKAETNTKVIPTYLEMALKPDKYGKTQGGTQQHKQGNNKQKKDEFENIIRQVVRVKNFKDFWEKNSDRIHELARDMFPEIKNGSNNGNLSKEQIREVGEQFMRELGKKH